MPFRVGDRVRFDETQQAYFQRYGQMFNGNPPRQGVGEIVNLHPDLDGCIIATFLDYSVCIDNPPTFHIFEADRIGVLTLEAVACQRGTQ